MPFVSAERSLAHCHGFVVDTDNGHLGSVLHVRETLDGEIELIVGTAAGLIRVKEDAIRHFDPHEGRIAVVEWTPLDPAEATNDPRGTPPADIVVDGNCLTIEVDLAGYDDSTIDVDVREHTLAIGGRRPTGHSSGHYLLRERPGSFRRELRLPAETDTANLHAHLHNGVLTIRAPYGDGVGAASRRAVEVQAGTLHPDASPV